MKELRQLVIDFRNRRERGAASTYLHACEQGERLLGWQPPPRLLRHFFIPIRLLREVETSEKGRLKIMPSPSGRGGGEREGAKTQTQTVKEREYLWLDRRASEHVVKHGSVRILRNARAHYE